MNKTWKQGIGKGKGMMALEGGCVIPNVIRQEQKVRRMAIFILTCNVRKTGKCHRGHWKAGWQFPNV